MIACAEQLQKSNNDPMHKILITGAAGFIGFHFIERLCLAGYNVYGIDNINDYYDPSLKKARLERLEKFSNFEFEELELSSRKDVSTYFSKVKPDFVVNLAAQAGVRYSLDNPHSYIDSNIVGFTNILEGCRHHDVKHLIFASSSSVYGANTKTPFSVRDAVDHPISLYAASKKANELLAHSYSHLYRLPCTGLRFFTVYGPWGRPDMAYYKFTKAIYEGEEIEVYNNGDMQRDFTYIDDITEAMLRLVKILPEPNKDWISDAPYPDSSNAPYRLYNIGNHKPEKLMDFIHVLEEEIGLKAKLKMLPMQPGDVYATFADVKSLEQAIDFKPSTSLKEGLRKFVCWYKEYYKLGNGPANQDIQVAE